MAISTKKTSLIARKQKVRAKLKKVSQRLRLSVFRSSKHIYGQIIDDVKGNTLVSACDQQVKLDDKKKLSKLEVAGKVGNLLAQRAGKKKIKEVYFDRGGYKYHGRIKALAQGAREGGLKF